MVSGRGDEEPNDGTRSDDDPPTVLIPGDPPRVGAASLDSPDPDAGMIGGGGHGMDECSCGRGPLGHTRDHVSTDRRGVVRIVREGKPDQYMDVRRVEAEALGIGREMRVREGLEVQARTPRVDPRSHRLEFGGARPGDVPVLFRDRSPMSDEAWQGGSNVWAWQDFPRHDPVVPPRLEKGFHCAYRDEEGRRCGREMNYGTMGLRHNPPLGVPHPRSGKGRSTSASGLPGDGSRTRT